MERFENYSLKPFNTFGIDVKAKHFVVVSAKEEVGGFLKNGYDKNEPLMVLGGGSNVLFLEDYEGTILKVGIGGIRTTPGPGGTILVTAGAGLRWDGFVEHCVRKGWAGLENLSLIPGNVGSGPIQNIGAYGVEIGDVIHRVRGFRTGDGSAFSFSSEKCRFGYRDSIFKGAMKFNTVITSVTFRLHRMPDPSYRLKLDYGTIRKELDAAGVANPGIADVREAVIRIRTSKLPDPAVIGNAGSFFKNPVVSEEKATQLRKAFPGIPEYPDVCGVKIPAAWLIEQCGWKGYRSGNVGDAQPLVLVNYGRATGQEVVALAGKIISGVTEKFGIMLFPEVETIGMPTALKGE